MSEREKPLITTIVPTYRRPKLLRRAIKSVLNQTYPHFQVCVYDNASGDETASVVAEFAKKDSRVKYHCHPENIGAIKNFNYGMEHVDTPFFSFLSDDDYLLPNFYELSVNALLQDQESMFFSGSVLRCNDKNEIIPISPDSWKTGKYYPPDGFLPMCNELLGLTGILFRTAIHEKIGYLGNNFLVI